MAEIATLLGWVAVGSAFGGIARFFVSSLVARSFGETFPWGTMVVNVTGAFAIGVLSTLADTHILFTRPEAWPLTVTGFIGSYTTVSSFGLQTLALIRDGEWPRALGNVVLSLVLCLAAVAAGVIGALAIVRGGLA